MLRVLAGLSALALTVAACGSSADEPEASAEDPLTFEAATPDGSEFQAADVAGEDTVLWFWAPWCAVCRTEGPDVVAVAEEFEGRVNVIGVGSSGTLEQMQAFVDETGTSGLTQIADVSGEVWAHFDVVATPTFVFINDDGRTQTFAGGLGRSGLADALGQLVES